MPKTKEKPKIHVLDCARFHNENRINYENKWMPISPCDK